MILSLTTINQHGHHQKFSCWVSHIAFGLDVASQIAREAHRLLSVSITDEQGNRMQLPIAVFDGASFSVPMNLLEIEWQAVLSEPISRQSVHHQGLIELARQHMATFRRRIRQLELAIDQTNHQWCALKPLETQDAYCSTGLRQYLDELASY